SPPLPNASVGQKERAGEQDYKPRQVVIELAFAFPGQKRRLGRSIDAAVHGHGHSVVHPVHSIIFRAKSQLRRQEKRGYSRENHGQNGLPEKTSYILHMLSMPAYSKLPVTP